jgi:hypothetical protein
VNDFLGPILRAEIRFPTGCGAFPVKSLVIDSGSTRSEAGNRENS